MSVYLATTPRLRIYSIYEDKIKGKNYEEELYPKLLDYNDNHLNSV
jgi:hypothetical protein